MSASSSASAVPRLPFAESALGFVNSSSEGRSGFYPTAFPPDLLALGCLQISASSIDPPASATQLPLGPVAVVIGLLRPPTGVRYCTGRFAGFKRPRTDVGVTQTDGIHYFDPFAYLHGREATATLRDHLGRGLDCSFTTVEYGDVPAFVEAGYFAPGTYRDCVIVGEKRDPRRRLRQLGGARTLQPPRADPVRIAGAGGSGRELQGLGPGAAAPEARALSRAVTTRGRPAVDVHAGLAAMRPVEAA